MHVVLQNLLGRQNKSVPVNDGKKIILVLFGGIMVSARGAAALAAFEEMGLTGAFDEIYTMSSGFANSSYFLSGQMKQGVAAYYQDMSGVKFLKPYKPWALADLDYLERVVKTIKPLNIFRLYESKTKFKIMLTGTDNLKKGIFVELRDFSQQDYFKLLRACSSLPLIAGGSVKIAGKNYRDIFYSEALVELVGHALKTGPTEAVMVYNYDWQKTYIHSKMPNLDFKNIYEFCPGFFAGKNEWLQKLTRFESRAGVLKSQCQIFGNEVKQTFGSQEPVVLL